MNLLRKTINTVQISRFHRGGSIAIGLLFLALFSCVEEFPFESRDYKKVLVIEGRFTDEVGTHQVKIGYTRRLDEQQQEVVSGAEVWVEGSDGSVFNYNETEPGVYETDPLVSGTAGISYQLHVSIDDKVYQSTKQKLIPSPPIEELYHEYKELVVESTKEVRPGIQFFIDTQDLTNQALHYRYEWEETYEVRPPWPSQYEYLADLDTLVPRLPPLQICYRTAQSSDILLGSTAGFTENKLSAMPVRYITTATDQLKYAYSILVHQYAISSQAYNYYRELNEGNSGGSLFDSQLGTLQGNLTSLNDASEVVLGFFEVSGKSSRREFVRYEWLDKRFPPPDQYYNCSISQVKLIVEPGPPYEISDSLRYYVVGKGLEVIEAVYCDDTGSQNEECPYYLEALLAPKYCTDCRFRGTLQKPDYWIF